MVNGNLRGAKEQRPFKPQVEGSIPSRRIAREPEATVLVGEEIELLLTPLRRGPLDRCEGTRQSTSPTACVSAHEEDGHGDAAQVAAKGVARSC